MSDKEPTNKTEKAINALENYFLGEEVESLSKDELIIHINNNGGDFEKTKKFAKSTYMQIKSIFAPDWREISLEEIHIQTKVKQNKEKYLISSVEHITELINIKLKRLTSNSVFDKLMPGIAYRNIKNSDKNDLISLLLQIESIEDELGLSPE